MSGRPEGPALHRNRKRSNQRPTVSLSAPSNGARFTAPATIALAASASDPDGTVARVEFHAGSNSARNRYDGALCVLLDRRADLLEVFAAGANPDNATPVSALNLGKPTPDASGLITVNQAAFFNALPPGSYIATVSAAGSSGKQPAQRAGVVHAVIAMAPISSVSALSVRETGSRRMQSAAPVSCFQGGRPRR